ncbi:MAG: restriction endonuclease subunit S [Clostridia bacterium]|nr:restriction endonuclease subunit S [Clostridia bacterium]
MELTVIDDFVSKLKQNKKVDRTAWKEFDLIGLFPDIGRGTRLVKANRQPGTMPLVTAGQFNNGISCYILPPKENEVFENCVTIDMFGNCFYQQGQFVCDDNVYPIKNIQNKYVGLFIATVLHNAVEAEFDFSKQVRLKQLQQIKIKLPVDKDGNPDFKYMEKYMQDLEVWVMKKF